MHMPSFKRNMLVCNCAFKYKDIKYMNYVFVFFVPGKVLSNQGPDLLAVSIHFLPCIWFQVYLPVWTQWRGILLASEDPNTRNGSVVVDSKDGSKSKGILPQFVQSLGHSYDEVTTHDRLDKLMKANSMEADSAYHRDQPSLSKCSPKYHIAAERMALLEHFCLNSSNKKIILAGEWRGPWPWAQQPVPAHIGPAPLQELWQLPFIFFPLSRGFFSSHELFSFLGLSFLVSNWAIFSHSLTSMTPITGAG